MDPISIAALLQTIPVIAPPAPPTPPSPPVIYTTPLMSQRRLERSTIDVEVKAANELLWTGAMVVTTAQGANFLRRVSDAPADGCPPGYGQQDENSLSIQLNPLRVMDGSMPTLGVSVRWGHSAPGSCPNRASSRSVELSETVALQPGQSVTLHGDGDLSVRLRRR